MHHIAPLTFEPILKRARWGGQRLGDALHKPLGPHTDYAESWEIADHRDDQSVVNAGPMAGHTLRQLLHEFDRELLGQHSGRTQFPLLIKFLDANDWLSLQVHPNDEQARRFDPLENGKTESWIILEAIPGSQICAGLKTGIDRTALVEHLAAGTIEACLHWVDVQPGDCVLIPAGTVHAIGAGIVLAEIQQQSNMTFRIHDWGRMGTDGRPRPIHIEESLDCIDFSRGPVDPITPTTVSNASPFHEQLVRSNYFAIDRYSSQDSFEVATHNRFHIVMCLTGSGTLIARDVELKLRAGTTALVPAASETFSVVPDVSGLTVLDVCLP